MNDNKRVIVALDFNDINDTYKFIDTIDPKLCRLKIGKEIFTKYGPECVNTIHKIGFEVFLDLKFHDIPTTVYKACLSAFSPIIKPPISSIEFLGSIIFAFKKYCFFIIHKIILNRPFLQQHLIQPVL